MDVHLGDIFHPPTHHVTNKNVGYFLLWPSGGFRNSERGVQPLAREARPQIFGLPRPLSVTLEVQTEYLEATLGLVKCLEISKELIRECVTMPGCCCCMPLLHNHLMDS